MNFFKGVLFLTTITFLISCGGGTKVLRSGNTGGPYQPIDYISPIYSFAYDSVATSRAGINLVKEGNFYVDSVLTAEKERFKIGRKIRLKGNVFPQYYEETRNLFETIIEEETLEAVPIPRIINSILEENNTRYALLFYKRPLYKQVPEKYLWDVSLANGKTFKLMRNDLYFILLNRETDEIAFFGRAPATRSRPDLKEIFSQVHSTN